MTRQRPNVNLAGNENLREYAGKRAGVRSTHRTCGQMRGAKKFIGALSERPALIFIFNLLLFNILQEFTRRFIFGNLSNNPVNLSNFIVLSRNPGLSRVFRHVWDFAIALILYLLTHFPN